MRKCIEIIGAPWDVGANVRGAFMGPQAIRMAGIRRTLEGLNYDVVDSGDLFSPSIEIGPSKALPFISEHCQSLMLRVQEALAQGYIPLVLGGDHSVAIGTMSGVAAHYFGTAKKVGLIWIDAHADINVPESSPTGNIHGMPLAVLLGSGFAPLVNVGPQAQRVLPQNVALIGLRDLDAPEQARLKHLGVAYFTMRDIDERGMAHVMKDALLAASLGTEGIHVSFDLDSIDPLYAPGVSARSPGGLMYREARLACEMIHESKKLISLEFVELNPSLDQQCKTAKLCVALIASILGRSII